jgi:hypothetical protein
MQNKQNYTTCLYIGPCKAQKDKAKNALDKAHARVFSILLCLSMCSRSLNSSPKGPRPSNNLARVLNKLWPKCTRPKPTNQLPCIKESCLVYKSNQPIHVSKKMEPSPSLHLRNPHSSPRGIHSVSLCFKCSSQSSRTKP